VLLPINKGRRWVARIIPPRFSKMPHTTQVSLNSYTGIGGC
jgi:hypothetical protein